MPIVYYEGAENWTAVRSFHERVHLSDVLGKYIPDFEYEVIPLVKYSNQDLIEKKDELSLIMLINKLRNSADFRNLQDIPEDYFEHLEKNTPDYLLKLIGKIISVLLYRLNVPRKEVEAFTDRIERRKFDMLFDSFEAYDVQETRRISRAEGKAEAIVELLQEYGEVPKILKEKIMNEQDLKTLSSWVKAAARSGSVDEFLRATGIQELEKV